jgi:hypothetical protein
VEDRIDGLQSPILVKYAIAEDSRPVKHDARVVQEIQERVRVTHTTHFVANVFKFRAFY